MGILVCLSLVGCQSKTGTQTVETQQEGNNQESTNEQTQDNQTSSESSAVSIQAADIQQVQGEYSDKAIAAEWSESDATNIVCNGTEIQVEGSGATVENNTLTITKGGTYILSGSLTDGKVVVNTDEDKNVQLVLNGVSLTSLDYAPITILNAKNAYITLAEGTTNTINDGTTYDVAEGEDEPSAAIFSKDDLIINGSGALVVTANYKDGITSKDDLQIISGTITIQAADDGIVGKDSVCVRSGKITIDAQGDGIKSTNTDDSSKGYIVIDGGTIEITSGSDGIQAQTQLTVNDGALTITTNGGSANGSSTGNGQFNESWGKGNKDRQQPNSNVDTDNTEIAQEEQTSAKALKADNAIGIFGGTVAIDSSDDSIHTNGALRIAGGIITMSSGDDGMHSDSDLLIDGGTIVITKSYEGIESQNITINDGSIHIVSTDDGVNISGGNDSSSMNGRPGQNTMDAVAGGVLTINGGTLTVNADGDGLDSNGNIVMTGGMVTVYGPTNDGNGALDYDGTFNISGGTLLVAGSSGMAQVPTDTSEQATIAVGFTSTVPANTQVTITNDKGDVLYSFTPEKDFAMVADRKSVV